MRFLSWNRMRAENSNTGNMLQITELERKRSRKCSSILTVSMASREREKIAKFPSRHQHTIASLLSVEPENSPTDVQMFCRLFFLCSVATRHPPMRIAFRSFLLPLFSKGLVCNKTQAHLIYLSEKQQCIQRRGQGQGLQILPLHIIIMFALYRFLLIYAHISPSCKTDVIQIIGK